MISCKKMKKIETFEAAVCIAEHGPGTQEDIIGACSSEDALAGCLSVYGAHHASFRAFDHTRFSWLGDRGDVLARASVILRNKDEARWLEVFATYGPEGWGSRPSSGWPSGFWVRRSRRTAACRAPCLNRTAPSIGT